MPLTIRNGNGTDFGAIMPMVHRSIEELATADPCYTLRPDADARLRHWLGPVMEDPRGLLLIAEVDDVIGGFLAATIERTVPIFACDRYALVRLLWVEPEHRRHGVASALLDRAAEEYAVMDIEQLRIRARPDEASVRTLEKATFHQSTVTFVRDLRRPNGRKGRAGHDASRG